MNTQIIRAIFVVVLVSTGTNSTHSQGFANLDFESAIQPLVPDAFGMVPAASALPNWTVYIGGNQVNTMGYNSTTIDAADVSLHTTYIQPIEGAYSVLLQSATIGVPSGHPVSAAIGQVGTIPFGSQTLLFVADYGVPQVTFESQSILISPVGSYGSYTLYGGDVSMLAGQTGELLFSVTRANNGSRQQFFLDAISFSSVAVPEPTTFSLLALGALGLIWRRNARK
jgi:hypothetical protein